MTSSIPEPRPEVDTGCVYAFDHWPRIEIALRDAAQCLLLLDYDGTLSAIVNEPSLAVPAPGVLEALAELQRLDDMRIAVVSGRSLEDIRSRLGLDLIYGGNHGLEIEGPGIRYVDKDAAAAAPHVAALCDSLAGPLSAFPGALLERKGLTASVHFRCVPSSEQARLIALVGRIAEPFSRLVEVREGKKVLELRPRVASHKGTAARLILETFGSGSKKTLPVCLGDDATDEDIFREFPDGVTVHVGGPVNTAARYFLAGVPEVVEMLNRIARTWRDRKPV
jgi:trehalose-phosphatase